MSTMFGISQPVRGSCEPGSSRSAQDCFLQGRVRRTSTMSAEPLRARRFFRSCQEGARCQNVKANPILMRQKMVVIESEKGALNPLS